MVVPDHRDQYPETDQSLCENHSKTAPVEQILSTSCLSGLAIHESWSGDLLSSIEASPASPTHARGPEPSLRGRRSSNLWMEEVQDDFIKNRFAAVVQQGQRHQLHPNLCMPPTRRPSVPAGDYSSRLEDDLTSACKSFNDSSIINVDTETLEQDQGGPIPNADQKYRCLHPGTNSRGAKILPDKPPRRLTPTLEVPEEQDQPHWGEGILVEMPLQHITPAESTTTPPPLRDGGRTRNRPPRTTPRQKVSRDSITLESAFLKSTAGNTHWGVKSSLTLDSALFDESAVQLSAPDEDECPSKRTSWAVGSSLTLATFDDSQSLIKSAGHDDPDQQSHHHQGNESAFLVANSRRDFLQQQEMNNLRFSSYGDSTSIHNARNEHRTIPCTFSSISPCSKPVRTQSIPERQAQQ